MHAGVSWKWYQLSRSPDLWSYITLDLKMLGFARGTDDGSAIITDKIFADLTSLSDGIRLLDLVMCRALSLGKFMYYLLI